jgi:dUTP pyrophosphatase
MINSNFERITKYKDDPSIILPKRGTRFSAGYDICCGRDTEIPPIQHLWDKHRDYLYENGINLTTPKTLTEAAEILKNSETRPTLVPTGIKWRCKNMAFYLQLTVRSSTSLKDGLVLANSIGIIDNDYYNNEDNEGEIFGMFYNMNSFPVVVQKGDKIMQGIILPYQETNDDDAYLAGAQRNSGFGSTGLKGGE